MKDKLLNVLGLFLVVIGWLLSVLSVVGGVAAGVGIFAYIIYLIILLIKGTTAVSFFAVLAPVGCWIGAGVGGWIVGLIGIFFGQAIRSAGSALRPRRRSLADELFASHNIRI